MAGNNTLVCTNCSLKIEDDPGASGKRCPKCGNGALTWEDSDLVGGD